MRTLTISLPDSLSQYLEEQITNGDYSNASEYFCDLVRSDQKRNAKAALLASLAESHDDEDETAQDW